jgi:GTP cyclohydrolase II
VPPVIFLEVYVVIVKTNSIKHLRLLQPIKTVPLLGLPADARNYDDAIAILKLLGYTSISLITNNPLKEAAVSAAGIAYTTHHVNSNANEHNKAYLDAKINIGHHHIK